MQRSCPVTGLLGGFFLLAFILVGSSLAQITFERTYGGPRWDKAGFSVQQTSDGGYIIAGSTESFGAGSYDVYLIKTDSLGDTLWARTYGGALDDEGFFVDQTLDGGYVVTGFTSSFGAGDWDVYLIKTDSLGDTLWTRTYGGASRDYALSVQQTSDGGYILTGLTKSFCGNPCDVYVIKTDSFGNTLWARTYGGPYCDGGRSVRQTSDGGYIIVGEMSFSRTDVYLIKIDSLGIAAWTRTYDRTSQDIGCSVQQTSDEGFVITGLTGADVYLIKTDSLGDTLWTRVYGGSSWDQGVSVQQTPDGDYIIAGYTYSFGSGGKDIYLIKTDSLGDTLYTRTYGGLGSDEGYSVFQTSDGGYIIGASTTSFGAGEWDVYLIKTDENGFVGILEENGKPKIENRRLFQNLPNPFRGSTVISYSLPAATHVTLEVFDITGRLVENLVDENQRAGVYQLRWNAKNKPGGVYFYRLKAGEFTDTKKMVIVD